VLRLVDLSFRAWWRIVRMPPGARKKDAEEPDRCHGRVCLAKRTGRESLSKYDIKLFSIKVGNRGFKCRCFVYSYARRGGLIIAKTLPALDRSCFFPGSFVGEPIGSHAMLSDIMLKTANQVATSWMPLCGTSLLGLDQLHTHTQKLPLKLEVRHTYSTSIGAHLPTMPG